MLAVSPAVRNYSRIVEIIDAETHIVTEYQASYSRISSGGHFTTAELAYISKVYATLFAKSLTCIDELTMVVTAGELRMSDAERLKAIDDIHTDITGQLGMLRSFDMNSSMQELQRARTAADITTLKNIYGIPN